MKTLVGLSRFVIVDLSGPSVPQELYATVPHFKVPFATFMVWVGDHVVIEKLLTLISDSEFADFDKVYERVASGTRGTPFVWGLDPASCEDAIPAGPCGVRACCCWWPTQLTSRPIWVGWLHP